MTAVVEHNRGYGMRGADLLNILSRTGVGVGSFLESQLADELVVGVLVFLVPLILPIPVMFLGLFTSAIQALIFATLAAYYIGEAVEEHH